jgi:hypothetical protein
MEATDQEIFDQAIGEQTENVPETPTEAPTEAKEERVRDEKGRFVSAATDEPQEVETVEAPQPEAEKPVTTKDEDGARVPSWRLAEEADRRRTAEQALNELRNEMRQVQMQLQQQAYQPQPQTAPQEAPDIFADPQGFVQNLTGTFEQRFKQLQLENSLRFAHQAHGDKFNQAYQEFTDHVAQTQDKATYQRVMASHDPGEALVQWYKDRSLQKELGGSDLKTFLEKQREEWLKDPAVQAKVIEAFKATQNQAQPSNLTSLPPSLSKAAAARSAHDEGGSSGDDIYSYATGRR